MATQRARDRSSTTAWRLIVMACGTLGLLTLTLWPAAATRPPDGIPAPPDDREVSAGAWDVVAVEWDGATIDPEWLARLKVIYRADGSWAVFLRRLPVAEGRSTTRQDSSPKTFEMATLGSEGIEPSRFIGIYRIDGDVRMLCIVREGMPLPDRFAAPRDSRRMLVTLRRSHAASPP